jgi:hypothetical protein
MARLRLSWTEKRRRRLARQVDRLDKLEPRSLIVEPINITLLAQALRGAVQIGFIDAFGGSSDLFPAIGGPSAPRAAHHPAAPTPPAREPAPANDDVGTPNPPYPAVASASAPVSSLISHPFPSTTGFP